MNTWPAFDLHDRNAGLWTTQIIDNGQLASRAGAVWGDVASAGTCRLFIQNQASWDLETCRNNEADISMALFDPILELEAEIAQKREELKKLRTNARKDALIKIRELAILFDLTAEDLAELAPGTPIRLEESNKKQKAPVKYYDPNSGKSWSGAARGKIPEPFNTIIKNYGGDREAAAEELSQYLVDTGA